MRLTSHTFHSFNLHKEIVNRIRKANNGSYKIVYTMDVFLQVNHSLLTT